MTKNNLHDIFISSHYHLPIEENTTFRNKISNFDCFRSNKFLKQIKWSRSIHTCAPISELPPYIISTMSTVQLTWSYTEHLSPACSIPSTTRSARPSFLQNTYFTLSSMAIFPTHNLYWKWYQTIPVYTHCLTLIFVKKFPSLKQGPEIFWVKRRYG